MELSGKVALITGGARIGAEVARSLSARGVSLALTYNRSEDSIRAVVRSIADANGHAVAFKADLLDDSAYPDLIERIRSRFGRLDFLVHMASVYRSRPLLEMDGPIWDEEMNIHARSAYLLALAAAPALRSGGCGRVVLFSDWTAQSCRPRYKNFSAYYISKKAAAGVAEALALELAPDVLVNAVAPGPILPPPDLSDEEKAAVERSTPLGRWGGSESIVKSVLFLIETDFITGECIRVDGGRHLL